MTTAVARQRGYAGMLGYAPSQASSVVRQI